MAAQDHTQRFLDWMTNSQITRFDVAVARPNGTWVNRHDLGTGPELDRHLRWMRSENAQGADCYIRPARSYEWPVVFLDDLDASIRDWVVDRFGALAVHTSREGGYQIWIRTLYPLAEADRRSIQRALISELDSGDPGSVSGEHFGRLPGTKNQKRGGQWINVRRSSREEPLETMERLARIATAEKGLIQAEGGEPARAMSPSSHRDQSASGREWRWVCEQLELRQDPEEVVDWLAERAARRGKRHPEAYAGRTVAKAWEHLATG